MRTVVAAALACLALALPAAAQETPSKGSKKIPELLLGTEADQFAVSQKDFTLIPGQGYRWPVTSSGGLEYKLHSSLFRNVWMNQIVINDLEVHMNGAPAWLEFDGKGTMLLQFTTVRPGDYEWWIEGLEDKGMKGKITIK